MAAELAVCGAALPPTCPELLDRIAVVQDVLLSAEQIAIRTEHILHGSMYTRTIRLAPGVVITGALVKVPTVLIIDGHCSVLVNEGWAENEGYNVIPAGAGRKQIFVTREPVTITMIFATKAKTVAEAEAEFTDEAERLMSRRADGDLVIITGE